MGLVDLGICPAYHTQRCWVPYKPTCPKALDCRLPIFTLADENTTSRASQHSLPSSVIPGLGLGIPSLTDDLLNTLVPAESSPPRKSERGQSPYGPLWRHLLLAPVLIMLLLACLGSDSHLAVHVVWQGDRLKCVPIAEVGPQLG